MEQQEPRLASFERPPVVEALVGIEFVPIPELTAYRICTFAESISEDYPHTVEHFAVGPDGPFIFGTPDAPIQSPILRLWMLAPDNEFLLQLQFDRLILNWRKIHDSAYPRFPAMRERFLSAWAEFVGFLERAGVSAPTPLIAEVSYVNLISLDPEHQSFSALNVIETNGTREMNGFSLTLGFQVAETGSSAGGTVQLLANRTPQPGDQLSFNVTSRLAFEDSGPSRDIRPVLDDAHVVAVDAFAENTAHYQHQKWGIRA